MREPFRLYIADRAGVAFCYHSCRTLKEAQDKQATYNDKEFITTYIKELTGA